MKLRWFLSGTVREATELAGHVQKLLNAQRDILAPVAVGNLTAALQQVTGSIASKADKETLQKQMSDLEKVANKWLKPYPNAAWRENIEVLLVAIAVAMGIRTFFLQPFKIPTGSMQPTLYGVTSTNLMDQPDFKMPNLPTRIFDACAYGTFYHEIIANDDGSVVEVPKGQQFGISRQTIWVQYKNQSSPTSITLWFAPDEHFEERTGVHVGQTFAKGEPILRFRETTGDHLFVDRVSYNFRHPTRGDIVVFKTHGIDRLIEITRGSAENQFYIKRLVGLPNERISIGEDRHIRVNGVRLDASTPHFENVYGFDPKSPPKESQYSGHVPMWLFAGGAEYQVGDKKFLVCGDNTMNSLDSRAWGDFPEQNVIGKSCFVYWPFLSEAPKPGRFGWYQR